MKRRVRVLRRALNDLQSIHDYIARDEPPRAGSFVDDLLARIESLDRFGDRGATPRDAALRQRGYRYLVHRDHLIFYKVIGKQVRVYRVLHGKRDQAGILDPTSS